MGGITKLLNHAKALGVAKVILADKDSEEASANFDAALWPFGRSGCTVKASPPEAVQSRARKHRRCQF